MLREQRGAHEVKRPRTRTYEEEGEEGEDDADAASTSPTGGGGDVGGEQEESGGSAREGSANAANDEVSGVVQQGAGGGHRCKVLWPGHQDSTALLCRAFLVSFGAFLPARERAAIHRL